jgi:hypothetical protein
MATERDLLDKTVTYLQKREGIDKASTGSAADPTALGAA